MHICFLCPEYPPAPHGGIGSFVQTLGRELVRSGLRVSVIGIYGYGPAFEGEINDEGVRVIRVPSRGPAGLRVFWNNWRLLRALQQLHRESPIDILEGNEIAFCRLPRSAPGLKLLRMHGGAAFFGMTNRVDLWGEKRSLRVADELCGVSQCVADGTRKLLGLGTRHIEVIPNPVDINQFFPADPSVEEDGLIVFTGTVTARKGIRELVRAMPRIVAAVPHARLEVYGGENVFPPPPVPLAKQLSDSLPPEIAARISWKGRVSRSILPDALRRASVCVYPSYIEAMPIGWLEGLATGKAVVASQTGPGPEIIEDGVTGLLCDPYNPDSIADKVIGLLKDPAARQRLGSAARRLCVERYTLPALVERNINYYRTLLGRNSK